MSFLQCQNCGRVIYSDYNIEVGLPCKLEDVMGSWNSRAVIIMCIRRKKPSWTYNAGNVSISVRAKSAGFQWAVHVPYAERQWIDTIIKVDS